MPNIEFKQIQVSEHAKIRYCERINGLDKLTKSECPRDNEINIKRYLVKNKRRIEHDIKTMFFYSKFLYRGSFGRNNRTKDYYIRDDIILVTEVDKPIIITLYRINQEGNGKEFVTSCLEEISILQEQITQLENGLKELSDKKILENKVIDIQVKNLEQQIKALLQTKMTNLDSLENQNHKLISINKELDRRAHFICNNVDFNKTVELEKEMAL